ncbi:MAG: N,N-dimethylformamidase beta subunit family domain-containing protein, partial [Streptosporangiaceae bacterium]
MGSQSHPSRRAFIGLAAAAAGTAGYGAVKLTGSSDVSSKSAAPTVTHRRRQVSENSLQGDPNWPIRHLGTAEAMLGYTGQASVLPGEPIRLYASTTARSFTVSAFRMGWYRGDQARLVWRSGTVHGSQQSKPAVVRPTNTVQTAWGPSLTIPTDDWPEGSYLLRMDSESGPQRFVPVTVRSADGKGKVVIKNSVATWQAYNTWGGYDLYNGPGGLADYSNRSLVVSLDRPYDASGAYM